jgi:hypothetical protein
MSVGSTELKNEREVPALPAPGAGMSVGSTELKKERRCRLCRLRERE